MRKEIEKTPLPKDRYICAALAAVLVCFTALDAAAQPENSPDWLKQHDRQIRDRLQRGDEDTVINWLLFGTSFTKERVVSRRITDFIAALRSKDQDERIVFARRVLERQGYRFQTSEQRARLERHLEAEVKRVLAERDEFMRREAEFQPGDVAGQIMAYSSLFRDRGLSLDTSILSTFAIEQALKTMRDEGLLLPNSVQRVAVIGPGLDFADKNTGYDFYPVQTLQPFTSIDSLVRLGLAASPAAIELTTFDISPRVNDHIQALHDRAQKGTPYVFRLPLDLRLQWSPELVSYWKSAGNRIGSEIRLTRAELRGINVRPEVAARVSAVDFNVVTEKWTGPPFDLVIATNVLVYYDKLDQSLAFANIESMLRPGGFFLTNNAVVESPTSQLRSVGVLPVRHSADKIDHVFWYQK